MASESESSADDNDWTRRLKFRHLEIFATLVDSGSVTAAAATMHLTQPGISHWLKELEEAVGAPLFVRGRRLALTPAGEVFLRHARGLLGGVSAARDELRAVRQGYRGRVRLGFVPVAGALLVPRVIASLNRLQTQIEVSLVEGTFDQLLPRLRKKEIDLVIGRLEQQALNSGFPHRLLYAESVDVVAGVRHPLTGRAALSWADVARYRWVLPPAGTPMRHRLEDTFAAHGLALPAGVVESASLLVNQILLAEGDYLGVLSSSLASYYQQIGVMRTLPLRISEGMGEVGLLWGEEAPSDVVKEIAEHLCEQSRAIAAGTDPPAP